MLTNDLPKNMDEYLRREDELDKVRFWSLRRYEPPKIKWGIALFWAAVFGVGSLFVGLAVYGGLHLIGVAR